MEKINRYSKIIYILWLRQLKRYYRSRARMIGALAQPVLFLVALGFGFGPIYQKAGGGNYIQFIAPGIIAMSIIFTAMFTGIEVIYDRQFGFLKETLVAPVPRWTIMLGRTFGGATVATIQGIVVFFIALLVGFRPENIFLAPLAIIYMVLIAFFFTAFGTAIASKMEDMQAFPIIINFLIMPLFFLSGALFPLSGLPKTIQLITYANPLSYGVDGIRGMLSGQMHFNFHTDFSVLLIFVIATLAIGSYLFSKIEV
ncbi:MAG: ABC transporter permease [Candidatus Moranbacteria bacterium]|nr:ABC transporter permease [bacterium]MDP1833940.1 ABC transporter permease [Candidatus Moranbacteria bacterium]MDZ4385301.1 ABC transporter permease [Candidatus Moranbacteria bacterium]